MLNYAKSPRYGDLLPLLGAQSMVTAGACARCMHAYKPEAALRVRCSLRSCAAARMHCPRKPRPCTRACGCRKRLARSRAATRARRAPVTAARAAHTEGHAWRVQRDAFTPGFSSAFLKSALPGFVDATEVRHAARRRRPASSALGPHSDSSSRARSQRRRHGADLLLRRRPAAVQHLVASLGAAADAGRVVQLHHVTVLTTLEIICKV